MVVVLVMVSPVEVLLPSTNHTVDRCWELHGKAAWVSSSRSAYLVDNSGSLRVILSSPALQETSSDPSTANGPVPLSRVEFDSLCIRCNPP